MTKKIVLAFSGGLDTSFCSVWLKEKGYAVHAVLVDTGGFSKAELTAIEHRAGKLGVHSFTVIDGTKKFYETCIRFLVFGNVLKNGTYPLSVSAERITQAILITEHAQQLGISSVAHGSTGAGNDQVRFDMLIDILLDDAEIITPIRDLQLSRQQEIDFLKAHGVEMDFTKAAYSVNKGIWGTSVGGKETLTSHLPLPEDAFPTPVTKTATEKISIGFEKGEICAVNGKKYSNPVEAIRTIGQFAAPFGIGRDIHVGDTIIGIKGRVGFEAAAPLLIIKAHHALEKHVLTKQQLLWKDQLATWYGNSLHEGLYFEPVMRDIEKFLENTQLHVTGEVFLTLHPYRFSIDGIHSGNDLMAVQKGAYGEMNSGWSGEDVKGFTKIFANQVKAWYGLHGKKNKIREEEIAG